MRTNPYRYTSNTSILIPTVHVGDLLFQKSGIALAAHVPQVDLDTLHFGVHLDD